jgi:hypothetical protein
MNTLFHNHSDKSFWHRYVDFYEGAFSKLGHVSAILEFGVFKGASIRWLAERFPDARIVGCDILPQRANWPVSGRIEYAQVDQGSVEQLRALFRRLDTTFDLIIEDGSHKPVHQRNCLVESISNVRDGGMYILEDIHSSHPRHPLYRALERDALIGPLHFLLAIEHLKVTGLGMDESTIHQLAGDSLFTPEDVALIFRKVQTIDIYKRATLPHRCFYCGRSDFDYAKLCCRCGADLYGESDSISAILRVSAS